MHIQAGHKIIPIPLGTWPNSCRDHETSIKYVPVWLIRLPNSVELLQGQDIRLRHQPPVVQGHKKAPTSNGQLRGIFLQLPCSLLQLIAHPFHGGRRLRRLFEIVVKVARRRLDQFLSLLLDLLPNRTNTCRGWYRTRWRIASVDVGGVSKEASAAQVLLTQTASDQGI